MAQALFYSSNAVAMTLAAGIASGDTTCNLSSTSGLPASFPFKLLVGWGTAQQEVVHCTALSGVVATITRGQDGTTAQAHSIGAPVVHGVSAREFNDLELHVGSTAAVHGITGSVVGTSDTQTLTNKTFDATSNVSGAPLVGTTTVQTLTNKTLSPPTSGTIGVVVKGLLGQSVNLQEWQDSTGAQLARITASGGIANSFMVTSGVATSPQSYFTNGNNAANVPLVVQSLSTGQTADLQQWQSSTGTPVSRVDAAGNIFATNLTNAWTAYTPTFTNCTSPTGNFAYMLMGKTLFIRGFFSGGTATAAAAIRFSLPASLTVASIPIPLFGINSTTAFPWNVGSLDTTNVSSAAALTAGQSLNLLSVAGVIQVN